MLASGVPGDMPGYGGEVGGDLVWQPPPSLSGDRDLRLDVAVGLRVLEITAKRSSQHVAQ